MPETFVRSAAALRQSAIPIIEEWVTRYERSRLRMPRPIDRRALAAPARGIVATLGFALAEADPSPGSGALRETEKLLAFAGGTFGMAAARAFDVVAFVAALRDTLLARTDEPNEAKALHDLFDWLGALAVDGYAASRFDALALRHRDSLEKGTPVVMVARELPAALLVGEPERSVLDSVFGRLLLSIVRVDARAAIIDGGGLVAPASPPVLEALAVYAQHRKVAGIVTVLCALPSAVEPEWTALFPPGVRAVCTERFDDAVAHAADAARHA